MPTYNSGTSNYPLNYDLNPTGSTTATVEYLLDQIRDSGTGVITQSGNTVVALNVNSAYTILQTIEETLGIDPAGSVNYGFSSVAERLDYLQNISGLSFLPSSGGSLFGDLTMSGTQAINVNTLASSGLTWTITNGASVVSSGAFSLANSGNVTINATGGTLDLLSTNLTASFNNSQIYTTNTNVMSGNTVSLLSTSGVIFDNTLLPNSAGVIDIGSSGAPFANIYVNNIISTGLGGINAYVIKSGDTMTGDLVLNSGISITLVESGTSSLGSSDYPFSGIYSKNIYGSFISGLSPITFNSDIVVASGYSITFSGSGSDIGSSGNRIGTIYADVLDANTVAFNGYVNESGDSMTGNLTFTSGNSIVLQSGSIYPETSGVGTVGTTGNYFSNLYTNQINGRNVGNLVFNEETGGTADGVNMTFTFAHAPLSGYAMVFVSGLLINPVTHYEISGTNLLLTGSMYAPTSKPIAGFYIY